VENAAGSAEAEPLAVLLGTWRLEVDFPAATPPAEDAEPARVEFEWLPGRRFLVQRWEIPVPEAPDGIAIIGWDPLRSSYLQHYFDSRGIARLYEMTLAEGIWTLSRTREDFSELSFCQRWEGRFSEDGGRIDGRWEASDDGGATWDLDFELSYVRE
jgi:hypothetical protein